MTGVTTAAPWAVRLLNFSCPVTVVAVCESVTAQSLWKTAHWQVSYS